MAAVTVRSSLDAYRFDHQTYVHRPSKSNSFCINLFHKSDGTVSQIRLNSLKSYELSPNNLFALIDSRLGDPSLSDDSYRIAETIANQAIQDGAEFLKPNIMSVNFFLPKDVSDTVSPKETQKEEDEEEESSCAICFGDLRKEDDKNDETTGFSLNCSHQFHIGCIGEWLLRRKTCPLCRGTVVDKEYD